MKILTVYIDSETMRQHVNECNRKPLPELGKPDGRFSQKREEIIKSIIKNHEKFRPQYLWLREFVERAIVDSGIDVYKDIRFIRVSENEFEWIQDEPISEERIIEMASRSVK